MTRASLRFRLLALGAALAALALVAVGGLVRVTGSGLGCPDWPLCHGGVVPTGREAPAIEYSHRGAATVVALLVAATAAWAWRRYRARPDLVVPALAAALLVPVQAVLGAVVVRLELPAWIVAVHFLVGTVFCSVAAATAARAWWRPGRRVAPPVARLAVGTAGAAAVLVALGAAVVAANAEGACGREWPACDGGLAGGSALADLQVAHRTVAYAVAVLAVAVAWLARRRGGPRLAWAPLGAVAAQVGIGVAMVLTPEGGARRTLEVLHVAGAGAVAAALAALVAATVEFARVPAPPPGETPRVHGRAVTVEPEP